MESFLEHIPNSSSKVQVFQSPEKKDKSVDHTVIQSKSNTDPALQWLTKGGGEVQFMIDKKEKQSKRSEYRGPKLNSERPMGKN